MRVTVVTITYSKRWHLLEQTLRAALEGGAERAVVIDNEADEEIASRAEAAFPGRVHAVRLEENQGSAGAYCAGLRTAMADGAEYLLLLDDDNRLTPGALPILQDVYRQLAPDGPRDNLAVLGFRPTHQPGVLSGETPDPLGESAGSFLGFHLKDLHRKIWTRLRPVKSLPTPPKPLDCLHRMHSGPFGGMFFHRSVIERFGLPDARFALYLDDVEFTWRITSSGGEVVLVPRAQIDDIEESWNTHESVANTFDRWLLLGSRRQVFYTARNWAYFQTHVRSRNWMLKVNKSVYLSILWIMARRRKAVARFQLIRSAIEEGERGRLGINPSFPLTK